MKERFTKVRRGLYSLNDDIRFFVKKKPNEQRYEVFKMNTVINTRSTLESACRCCHYAQVYDEVSTWLED